MARTYRVAVLPDIHIPHRVGKYLAPSAEAAMMYVQKNRPWDEIILLGDVLDMSVVSHFTENKPLLREGGRLAYEYQVLDLFLASLRGMCRKLTYIEGNHEERITRHIEQFPHLQGFIEIRIAAKLDQKRIGWHSVTDRPYRVGNAAFLHGHYTNKYNSERHSREYGDNIYFGHTHTVQSHTHYRHSSQPYEGVSLGCLCELNPYWLRGKPTRWVNAFGMFFFNDDGSYTRYVPIIVNGKFIGPDGKEYKG